MRRIVTLFSLLPLVACAGSDFEEDVGSTEQEAMTFNAMTFNAMTFNALSANMKANELMPNVPLRSSSYDASDGYSALRLQLHDGLTREFFSYLVSCALEPGQVVQWKDPFDGKSYSWKGELGLCPEWGGVNGKADQACQELVSSCLLARNNAFGTSVRLSTRGRDTDKNPMPLSSRVPVGDTYPDGSEVTAYQDCHDGFWTYSWWYGYIYVPPPSGPNRECGWEPEYVGVCEPGTKVIAGAGAPPPGACSSAELGGASGDAMLRVCDGLIGCKQSESAFLGQADDTCGTQYPSVSFTCPMSGTYSVLYGAHDSTQTVQVQADASRARHPAPEADVFGYREGAFYGNIFDTKALQIDVFVGKQGDVWGREGVKVKGSVYRNMWACWSEEWTHGKAYTMQRVCAGGSYSNCAATPVGACGDYYDTSVHRFLCKYDDGPAMLGDYDFQECKDKGDNIWDYALTVHLNQPCDLSEDPNLCETTK